MYKYNIYFLTKMGDLQNIHTALLYFTNFTCKRYTKDAKTCEVGVFKI